MWEWDMRGKREWEQEKKRIKTKRNENKLKTLKTRSQSSLEKKKKKTYQKTFHTVVSAAIFPIGRVEQNSWDQCEKEKRVSNIGKIKQTK